MQELMVLVEYKYRSGSRAVTRQIVPENYVYYAPPRRAWKIVGVEVDNETRVIKIYEEEQ